MQPISVMTSVPEAPTTSKLGALVQLPPRLTVPGVERTVGFSVRSSCWRRS
jgi:hypothetical protein